MGFIDNALSSVFGGLQKKNGRLDKEEVARLLKTSPEGLEAFENAYQTFGINAPEDERSLFSANAKDMAATMHAKPALVSSELEKTQDRIVHELIEQTHGYRYDAEKGGRELAFACLDQLVPPVTKTELMALPEPVRPWLTGHMYKSECAPGESYKAVLWYYAEYMRAKTPSKKQWCYNHFRQGLELLDLDPVLYEMLTLNPNSMGNWLPQIADAVQKTGFFKIPATTVIRVPLPLLQLSRLDYMTIPRSTLDIVDKYCRVAFGLDGSKEYFIKTGTFSSKYDFRNAHVSGVKEVQELGEYLLFIQHQSVSMSQPLNNVCIYGAGTTNEWVVREFIRDSEHNPCIYKGLPLHTEYRVFVDFDSREVLGISPYWEPKVMKARFERDPNSVHDFHDYAIYSAHEETLMSRYTRNIELVKNRVNQLLQVCDGLEGQWSIDIMQNGSDFWLIDMALAANSALKECVPAGRLKPLQEHWLPELAAT